MVKWHLKCPSQINHFNGFLDGLDNIGFVSEVISEFLYLIAFNTSKLQLYSKNVRISFAL